MNRILLTDGHTVIADAVADARGDIAPGVELRRGMLVTVISDDGSAVRHAVDASALVRGRPVVRDVAHSEFPAGISGQVWDPGAQALVTSGEVALSRGDAILARTSLDSTGRFWFALTRALPLTPGDYAITIAAGGFDVRRVALAIRGTATSWRLERIELTARHA